MIDRHRSLQGIRQNSKPYVVPLKVIRHPLPNFPFQTQQQAYVASRKYAPGIGMPCAWSSCGGKTTKPFLHVLQTRVDLAVLIAQ